MPTEGGESSNAHDLLNLAVELYDLLQKKDVSMGELLLTMQPKSGQESSVEQSSDKVVSMQGEVDEKFRRMIRGIRRVGDGLSAALPSGVGTGGSSRETEELRASIISVTKREKDRVEGLQAQLEMLRQELRECRKQRGMDQSHIAALESQSSQFKAALACAEDDLEALRTTLDKELGRSHVMQGRISQLEGETRGARKSAKEQDKEVQRLRELVAGLTPARQMEASPGRPGPNWGGEARQPAREEEYEASEREVYDAYVEARRGQLANSMGEARDAAGEALHETHTHRIPTGGGDSSANYSSDFSPSGETPSSEPTPARHRVQVRPASAKAAPRHQRASPDVVAAAPAAAPGGRAKRESTSTIEYLASQVASGHITKSTPLQLALEFCGKSSFSLRHNEEKYNELSQQLVTLAYQHLRDRWVTVLKNAEPTDNKGTMKAPRLGSFEVELLWTDVDGEPRRTMLHSKLKTRVFPNVPRIIDELTEALSSHQRIRTDGEAI